MTNINKNLYRRKGSTEVARYDGEVKVDVTYSHEYYITLPNPGWFSFDFMCQIPLPASGDLPDKWLRVIINGVTRFEVKGAWHWQRNYIFLDAGKYTVRFQTYYYGNKDSEYAKVRRVKVDSFTPVWEYDKIESADLPKPLESISTFHILAGWQRYQRSGPKGCQLEFVLVFPNIHKWRSFMATLEDFYVIKGDYGVYGGTILPQDVDNVRMGQIILTKVKMTSPMTAGLGVDGI